MTTDDCTANIIAILVIGGGYYVYTHRQQVEANVKNVKGQVKGQIQDVKGKMKTK